MSVGKQQARINTRLASGMSRLATGICTGVNWTTYYATVNVGGGTVNIPIAGDAPTVGDRVLVGFLGNQPICLGPVPKPPTGVVSSSPSGGRVNVTGDDGKTYTVAYLAGYTPASGNRVALEWGVPGGLILGTLSSETVPPAPTVPRVPDEGASTASRPKTYSRTFNATASGNYRPGDGWWSEEVWSSDNNTGLYFYGGQVSSTIPNSATILEIKLYLDSTYEFGSDPTIGLHNETSRSGAPSVTSAVSVPGGSGWKKLPISFGNALKTGSKKGLGTDHGGYHKFSPARRHNSGALSIKWRK